MSKEFIKSYYLSDLSLCNKLIDVFYQRENFEGTISGDIIDKKIKDSTDCSLCIQDLNKYVVLQSYFKELNAIIEKYKIKYTFCNDGQAEWELEKSFNIQKYKSDK